MKKIISLLFVLFSLTLSVFAEVRVGCSFEDLLYLKNKKADRSCNYIGANPQIEFTIYKNLEGVVGANIITLVGKPIEIAPNITMRINSKTVDFGLQYQILNKDSLFLRANVLCWFTSEKSIKIDDSKASPSNEEYSVFLSDYMGEFYVEPNIIFGKAFKFKECGLDLFTSVGARYESGFVPLIFRVGCNFVI